MPARYQHKHRHNTGPDKAVRQQLLCRKGTPPGARLRRGYQPPKPSDKQAEVDTKQEEVENYCGRVPVDRLVLACHGIGQKLAASNIAHDAACMRLLMRQLSQVALHSPGDGGFACVCRGPGGGQGEFLLFSKRRARYLVPPEGLHTTGIET